MLKKIVSLSKKLIAIKSDPKNKKALLKCLRIVESELSKFTIERFESNGYKSILVYNSPLRPKNFRIILNGHLDIIPGKDFQYKPKIIGNRLYGVGAMDMKASVACLILAFNEAATKVNYPIGLQLVTDEEIGGFNGTKYQIAKGITADFIITGEATQLNIANKAKGVLWLKISSKGKAAHSAYPWRGINAITKMNKFLNTLQDNFLNPTQDSWVTTVNVSSISSMNKAFNKIPDNCEVLLDIRYIPEEIKQIVNRVKKLLPADFKMQIIEKEPAVSVDIDNKYLNLLKTVSKNITKKEIFTYGANGSSDVRHFTKVKCPGVEFGPKGGGIGSDKEWVNIPSLMTYYQILKRFLLSI